MNSIDYFDILGIDPGSTTAQIKKAFRRLALKYHPDHNKSPSAKKYYARIIKAYNMLVDPVKREEYIRGKACSVTEDPWDILENYWSLINGKIYNCK